jgi:hypothetical protein
MKTRLLIALLAVISNTYALTTTPEREALLERVPTMSNEQLSKAMVGDELGMKDALKTLEDQSNEQTSRINLLITNVDRHQEILKAHAADIKRINATGDEIERISHNNDALLKEVYRQNEEIKKLSFYQDKHSKIIEYLIGEVRTLNEWAKGIDKDMGNGKATK